MRFILRFSYIQSTIKLLFIHHDRCKSCVVVCFHLRQFGAYCSRGKDVGFWIQRAKAQTQAASVCCVLEQGTLPELIQSSQL